MTVTSPTPATRQIDAQALASENKISGAASGTMLDYNAFLKLLIAQMQNQDPLEPMKSSDYVAQLATFSQVEKTVETNARMSDLLAAVQLQQAGAMIGQTVTSADGTKSGVVTSAKIVDGQVVVSLADGVEIVVIPGAIVGGRST